MKKVEKAKISQTSRIKLKEIKINKSLNQYKDKILFKSSVEKATETFKNLKFIEAPDKVKK